MASSSYTLSVELSMETISYSRCASPGEGAVVEEGHRVEPEERFIAEANSDETSMGV
jgi:hypothetical protein